MMLRKSPLSLVDCRSQGVLKAGSRGRDFDGRRDRLKRGFAICIAHNTSIGPRHHHRRSRLNAGQRRSFAAALVATVIGVIEML